MRISACLHGVGEAPVSRRAFHSLLLVLVCTVPGLESRNWRLWLVPRSHLCRANESGAKLESPFCL